MIREYTTHDIDIVMQIWLNTNIQSHNFISSDYWHSNFDMVREMLPFAEVYVYEDDRENRINGFIGLNENYIEGILVSEKSQSSGIGKQLLDYVKRLKYTLCLHVYQKNPRAIQFYQRGNFKIQSEDVDDNTGEKEFIMIWNQ